VSKRSIAVLIACFLTVLAAYSIRYSYGTLLPDMLPDLALNKAQAGIIYASYFVAYTVLSPVMGMLSDRYDMRIILSIFVIIMGSGTFLMQYSSSILQGSISFTLAGIGCAACWAPVMAVAQRWTKDNRRGLSLALVDAGSTLGVMTAGALIPLIISGADWRRGWMVLGLFSITLGFLNFILIRNRPASQTESTARLKEVTKTEKIPYKQILKDRRFWQIGLAYLLTGFAIIIPFSFLSTYAFQELAFSYSSATMLITLIGISGLIGKLTFGPVSDKVGRIKILLLCALLITAGCLGIALCRGWVLPVIVFIFGIGYGACWSLYAACASDLFSKHSAGGIIGLWTFLLGIGSICAPIVAGWTADRSGTLLWAFLIAAIAGLGSFILLLPMLNSQSRPSREGIV
jgi:MFS family permease